MGRAEARAALAQEASGGSLQAASLGAASSCCSRRRSWARERRASQVGFAPRQGFAQLSRTRRAQCALGCRPTHPKLHKQLTIEVSGTTCHSSCPQRHPHHGSHGRERPCTGRPGRPVLIRAGRRNSPHPSRHHSGFSDGRGCGWVLSGWVGASGRSCRQRKQHLQPQGRQRHPRGVRPHAAQRL
jgi:hypothetical protein